MIEWNPGTNICTQRARELLRPYALKRNEEAVEKASGREYLFCQKCRGKGIMTLHLKKDMEHLIYIKPNGKKYKVWYCKECFDNYVPRSKRVGGNNE